MTRAGRGLLVLVAGVVGALAATPAAAADPDEALRATWDGPTVNLAWDGSAYTTATTTFSGTPVAVPGDAQGRTVTVVNDGPSDATLRGWVQGVRLLDPGAPDVHHRTGEPMGDFYSDLTLSWRSASGTGSSSFRDLAAVGSTQVVEIPLARGASTQLTVVTALPLAATSGNRANVAPREASYEVLLRLDGRTTPIPTPTPSPTPSVGPVTPAPAPTSGTAPSAPGAGGGDTGAAAGGGPLGSGGTTTGALAITGLDALRAALLAVVGIGLGSLLLGAARRRREVQPAVGDSSTPSAG